MSRVASASIQNLLGKFELAPPLHILVPGLWLMIVILRIALAAVRPRFAGGQRNDPPIFEADGGKGRLAISGCRRMAVRR